MNRTHGIAALAVVLVLGAAATALVPDREGVDVPDEGPWTIAVATGFHDLDDCLDDEAVAVVTSSADLPSTRTALTFVESATRSDVERVASCLTGRVGADAVIVLTTDAG
ncbi:hypothetical protein [Cellulomonas soli]|uniref:Uncharacterized protein n=1 Tax=Cellulomonas soli TaxID=931535 RepID=A0A512P8E3_9CELL|nr:hypothetical protein [Cellulomonas soli]NYI57697.1 hypothetical protein [Cellulomonas soli]GEP67476.1 hypothetical protein CSO01_01910 [Cellulomonas soli]